jgi:hypothetical protein
LRAPFVRAAWVVLVRLKTGTERAQEVDRVLEAFSKFRREIVIAIGLKITEVAWVGVLTVFGVTYLTQELGMLRSVVLDAVTLATLIELFVMPLAGLLSDQIGRRTIYVAGSSVDSASIDLRPTRSSKWLKMMPPSGRAA